MEYTLVTRRSRFVGGRDSSIGIEIYVQFAFGIVSKLRVFPSKKSQGKKNIRRMFRVTESNTLFSSSRQATISLHRCASREGEKGW